MALYGLEKIRSTMETLWQYGDFLCAKEPAEVNFNHNTIYPLCMVVEPDSIMPSIYEGWENYSYEVYFCELWKKVNRDASTPDRKWDNIQYIANEWLDNVLDYYNNEDLILDDESLEVERIKNFGNDKLLAIKFTFTLQGFRTCFNPKRNQPDWFWGGAFYPGLSWGGTQIKSQDGTVMYSIQGQEYQCRGWWRFDGYKEVVMEDTVRYVKALKDMRYGAKDLPAANPVSFVYNNGLLYNENYNSAPTDYSKTAALKSESSNANSKFYGDQISGTQNGSYRAGWDGPITDITQQKYNPLNNTPWTIALCFEVGEDATADDGTFLFSTGDGGYTTDPNNGKIAEGFGIDIYIDNGKFIVRVNTPAGAVLSPLVDFDMTLLFGVDIYQKEDKTVAIVITYDGFALLGFDVPGKTQQGTLLMLSGLTAGATPWWNMNPLCLWNREGGLTTTAFKNKVYECFVYNFWLNAWPTTNPQPNDPTQDMALYLGDKYGIKIS